MKIRHEPVVAFRTADYCSFATTTNKKNFRIARKKVSKAKRTKNVFISGFEFGTREEKKSGAVYSPSVCFKLIIPVGLGA